jgi:hypothetical protein
MAASSWQSATSDPVTPFEAEAIIQDLKRFPLEAVGTAAWNKQHGHLERLNVQAHRQAKDATDEFIVDYLTSLDMIPTLVYSLVAIELWKEKVFPLVKEHVCQFSALRSYVPLYHEATLINLLECVMFHRTSVEAAGDSIIDLIDYCYRKLAYLCGTPNKELYTRYKDAKEAAERSDLQLIESQHLDTQFQVGMCALSVVRFLTDHRPVMPLSATTRLLDTSDFLLVLCPLLDKAPWVRKNAAGAVMKYDQQEWQIVDEEDFGKLPGLQVQVLLAIHNLVLDPECRARYQLTSFRKDTLLRIRRFLNEVVFDQVPPLANLLRTLEELSIQGQFNGGEDVRSTPFVVELIAEIHETLVQTYEGRYAEIAEEQKKSVFVQETQAELRGMCDLFAMPDEVSTVCAYCRADATERCSRCKQEWYCSRECQVKHWKTHKPLCDVHCAQAAARQEPLIEDVTQCD